LAE
jgi:hypothetical protein